MPLLDLPNELLRIIAENIASERDLNQFVRANHCLYGLLNCYLYRRNSRHGSSSALLWAAQNGEEKTARLALDSGASCQAEDKYGRTPLLLAVAGGHIQLVQLFLKCKGVDVNTHVSVSVPISHDWDDNRFKLAKEGEKTPLFLAMTHGHDKIAKLLLGHPGIGVKDITIGGCPGYSAFSWAIQTGRVEIMKLLLARNGVDVNAVNQAGVTPLALAALNGRREVMEVLLACKGIDVNARNGQNPTQWDKTPLQTALRHRRDAVVELLLMQRDIDIYFRGIMAWTAMDLARYTGYTRGVELLRGHEARSCQSIASV